VRYLNSLGPCVVLLAALLLWAGPATAGHAMPEPARDTSGYTYTPLLASRNVFPASAEVYSGVLTTPAFAMQKGDIRRVTDQLDVRIPSGKGNPELNNLIVCLDQHANKVAQVSTGTNYTSNGHAYQWNVSMLLTAPATENYVCQIWTYASSPNTNYVMTVLAPTPGQTTYGTWLEVSTGNQVGAQSWWYPRLCPSNDATDVCQYIGGPARLHNPDAIDVFSPPADEWTAGDDATAFDAVATFEITSCPSGTKSCALSERGGDYYSDGDTWLDVDQLYPDGTVCQVNRAYSEETTGGQVLLTERYDISDQQHHRDMFYHVSAPVSQMCRGSRTFAVDLHFQWTAGNPVKMNGGDVNVVVSATESVTTTTVPDVVGLTQAQADAAIQTAGLTVAAPDYVTSTTPAGTVLAQSPPGGTVDSVGSMVEITVSLGEVAVPDVLGDESAAAVQAIKAAGLTAVTLPPVNSCTDPGTVQSQSPPGGTLVAPGSQVDIQVSDCIS
jgi:PASTA domain